MTPATLSAIASGNLANALAASTPGGIERQEAQGQRDLIAGTTLPKEIEGATREQLTAIGFVFGDDADDLFVNVTLPTGWAKKATGHSMHSDLVDEKGRKRAGIFYKAAFYDRRADMRMEQRYRVESWQDGPEPNTRAVAITDCSTPIRDFGFVKKEGDYFKELRTLEAKARAVLALNFPRYEDPLAYWD